MEDVVLVQIFNGQGRLVQLKLVFSYEMALIRVRGTDQFTPVRVRVQFEIGADGAMFHERRDKVDAIRGLANTEKGQNVRVV